MMVVVLCREKECVSVVLLMDIVFVGCGVDECGLFV